MLFKFLPIISCDIVNNNLVRCKAFNVLIVNVNLIYQEGHLEI